MDSKITNMSLAIVLPVYNERENLPLLLEEWQPVLSHIPTRWIIINDGSTDETASYLDELQKKSPSSFIIHHQNNSGHGTACRTGYELALQDAAEWILQIDSDGQCDSQYFHSFWNYAQEHHCTVFGVRQSRGDGWARRWISLACTFICTVLLGVKLRDVNVPYRLIKRNDLSQALSKIPQAIDLQNIALALALAHMKLKIAWIPIHFRARAKGNNSVNVYQVLTLGWRFLCQVPLLQKALQKK